MRMIYYCSYKLSPVGFQMGSLECSHLDGKMRLAYENVPMLVFKSFTARAVHAANGLIPSSNEYAVLRKNINGEKNGVMFYLNFCFLAECEEEYLRARAFADRAAEEGSLFERIASTIEADDSDESFALTIDGTALKKLLDEIGREKIPENTAADSEKYMILSQCFEDNRREAMEFAEELHGKLRLDNMLDVHPVDGANGGLYVISSAAERKNSFTVTFAALILIAALGAGAYFIIVGDNNKQKPDAQLPPAVSASTTSPDTAAVAGAPVSHDTAAVAGAPVSHDTAAVAGAPVSHDTAAVSGKPASPDTAIVSGYLTSSDNVGNERDIN